MGLSKRYGTSVKKNCVGLELTWARWPIIRSEMCKKSRCTPSGEDESERCEKPTVDSMKSDFKLKMNANNL